MSQQEPDRIIDIKEVSRMVLYKRSSIYKKVAEGTFPAAIKIGPRRVGWSLRAVEKWINSRY